MICLSCLNKIFASEGPLAYDFPRLNHRYDTSVRHSIMEVFTFGERGSANYNLSCENDVVAMRRADYPNFVTLDRDERYHHYNSLILFSSNKTR